MDCHLNCHGELNMLVMGLPFLALLLARVRAGFRAAIAKVTPAPKPTPAGAYRTPSPPPEPKPEKRGTWYLCRGCTAAAAGGCHGTCLRSAPDAMMAAGVTMEEAARGFAEIRKALDSPVCVCDEPAVQRCPVHPNLRWD